MAMNKTELEAMNQAKYRIDRLERSKQVLLRSDNIKGRLIELLKERYNIDDDTIDKLRLEVTTEYDEE